MTAIDRLRTLEAKTREEAETHREMACDSRWPDGVRHAHKVCSTVLTEQAEKVADLIASLTEDAHLVQNDGRGEIASLSDLVEAAKSVEGAEAAWCGDQRDLDVPRSALDSAYRSLRDTLYSANDALETALRNAKRGSRTHAVCTTALERVRAATKKRNAAMESAQ